VAAVVVSLGALLLLRETDVPAPATPDRVPPEDRLRAAVLPSPGPTGAGVAPVARPRVVRGTKRRATLPAGGSRRDRAPADQRRPEIEARDYIEALRDGGETEGLAVFPPPGIHPPRSGVIVPDHYSLPEGFARHHQTTDDGRRLPPILVLAPGYELVDEAGDSVILVDGRIVPREFAPPDLPIEMLDVPTDPGPRASAR